MNRNIIDEIIRLIPKTFHPKKEAITLKMELEIDLGITGDDADEILTKFSERFNVNIDDFKFNDYFLSEGEDHLQILKSWFFKSKIKKHNRKRLTIGDLVKAVKSGKLVYKKKLPFCTRTELPLTYRLDLQLATKDLSEYVQNYHPLQ